MGMDFIYRLKFALNADMF